MTVKCLWLYTEVEKSDYKLAEATLNEILCITSCKITGHRVTEDGVAVVYFDIEDDKDIPKASINRLKTTDIKWEMDYPEYSLV